MPGRFVFHGIIPANVLPLRNDYSIAEAVGLPLVVFQYPPASGIGYSAETLVQLAEIPYVVAIKDCSSGIVTFERNLRAIRAADRAVAVFSSFTTSLFATFVLGADGAISGMGSVAADLQAELFAHVQCGDLDAARKVNELLEPLVRVFYAPPSLDMHNRMREGLAPLGRISQAVVRPPLQPIDDTDRGQIRHALTRAGLLR